MPPETPFFAQHTAWSCFCYHHPAANFLFWMMAIPKQITLGKPGSMWYGLVCKSNGEANSDRCYFLRIKICELNAGNERSLSWERRTDLVSVLNLVLLAAQRNLWRFWTFSRTGLGVKTVWSLNWATLVLFQQSSLPQIEVQLPEMCSTACDTGGN